MILEKMMKDATEIDHLHQPLWHSLELLSKENLIDSKKYFDQEDES